MYILTYNNIGFNMYNVVCTIHVIPGSRMVASIARAYVHFKLPRQFLVDSIWREHSTNNILQTLRLSQSQYQCYHTTCVVLKKRGTREIKSARVLLKAKILENPAIDLPETKKRKSPIIEIWDNMTVTELAQCFEKDVNDVLSFLSIKCKDITVDKNSILTKALATEVVKGFGRRAKYVASAGVKKEATYEDIIRRQPSDKSQLVRRPPIVTVMGHVDHGKTTLLDALRHTDVVKSEFGGITQHIGAFNVTLKSGQQVTFLDTPGHAVFTSMRYRGAHVTDIVVLVVAADDGVKDQTVQSIEMAKDANVPIIVALNKIDKPNTNIKKTLTELAQHDVIVEELGGDVQCVKISALKGINLEELTDAILLQAEIADLRGDPLGLVEGVIIECSSTADRGKLVTALIQRGTLKKGRLLVSGTAWAKVRSMFSDSGRPVSEAKPSEAVQIVGWRALPNVGDEVLEVKNDKELQTVLKYRKHQRDQALAKEHKVMAEKKEEKHLEQYKQWLKLKQCFKSDKQLMKELNMKKAEMNKQEIEVERKDDFPTVNVIIKGDVAGSVEALLDIFNTYKYENICRLNVVHSGIGPIIDSDLQMAETFDAIIYGFNVNIHKNLEEEVEKKGVSVRFYNVVYKLFDDLKEEIQSKIPLVDVEEVIGEAQVQQNFEIKEKQKVANVAGCRCVQGVLYKSAMYYVSRNNEIIYRGKLVSMRHLKEEISVVKVNLECGLRFEDPTIPFQPGDSIVCYKSKRQQLLINWSLEC